MSLMLEFRPPKNRDARLAGIGKNWSFPTVTPPLDAAGRECETTVAWEGEGSSTRQSTNAIAAHLFRDPLIASPAPRNYQ